MPAVDCEGAPDAASEIDQVNEQIVDCEDEEADTGEQCQLRREAAEDFANGHAEFWPKA